MPTAARCWGRPLSSRREFRQQLWQHAMPLLLSGFYLLYQCSCIGCGALSVAAVDAKLHCCRPASQPLSSSSSVASVYACRQVVFCCTPWRIFVCDRYLVLGATLPCRSVLLLHGRWPSCLFLSFLLRVVCEAAECVSFRGSCTGCDGY